MVKVAIEREGKVDGEEKAEIKGKGEKGEGRGGDGEGKDWEEKRSIQALSFRNKTVLPKRGFCLGLKAQL